MPELPEVETAVRMLRPKLVLRRIEAVSVSWLRTLGGASVKDFERAVVGAEIVELTRRAKYIVAKLERSGRPAGALVGHLRMTGRMYVESCASTPDRFVKVSLALDDGQALRFLDVRKFGRLVFAREPETLFAKLGPEPLGLEFTHEWLRGALRARERRMKPLLLDQGFLAGLGNIYVDESLHGAGIHPLARSDRLDRARVLRLHAAIQRTLRAAIEREGSSFDVFYRTPEGQPGSFQDQFQVYGRDGQACRACGTLIKKQSVGQRGTHWCPQCQKR